VQAIENKFPYETYLYRLIVDMVYNIIFWMNCIPLRKTYTIK